VTPEFVRCDFCKSEIPTETCKLATYSRTIDGKQFVFCCQQCAKQYEQRMRKEKK
jgi:YHS domain-containing protein